jgi:cytochrome oxidase Cu insertion factor (SCO1/SenC/PrrC family)
MKGRLLLVFIFGSVLIGFANPFKAIASDDTTLAIGATSPDFNLPNIDGKMYTLAPFKKSTILVIIFTCNHWPVACRHITFQKNFFSFV